MTTGDQLLRAVRDDPDDDNPRLIYADWLEDQGKTIHSRFIRSQIAGDVVSLPLTVLAPAADLFGIWKTHALMRTASTNGAFAGNANGLSLIWKRGFLTAVSCPYEEWLKCGPCLARCPLSSDGVQIDNRQARRMFHGQEPYLSSWGWSIMKHHAGQPNHVPEVFRFLPPNDPPVRRIPGARRRFYLSPESATHALSHACIAWARANPRQEPGQ